MSWDKERVYTVLSPTRLAPSLMLHYQIIWAPNGKGLKFTLIAYSSELEWAEEDAEIFKSEGN